MKKPDVKIYMENVSLNKDIDLWIRLSKAAYDGDIRKFLHENYNPDLGYTEEGKQVVNEIFDYVKEKWDTTHKITAKEAMSMSNAEIRMLALSYLNGQEIIDELGGELVDEQTITKTQEKTKIRSVNDQHNRMGLRNKNLTINDIMTEKVSYYDTYSLFKVSSKKMGIKEMNRDVYIVKCKDTSTDKVYYLYPDDDVKGAKVDAICAIASTMRKEDGSPLSKKEYLQISKES